jgi:hypothetical protein
MWPLVESWALLLRAEEGKWYASIYDLFWIPRRSAWLAMTLTVVGGNSWWQFFEGVAAHDAR